MSVFKQDSFLNNSSLACNSLTEEVNKMSANDKRPSTSKIDENPFAGEMYDDDDGFNTRFNNLYNALFNEKINKTETQDLIIDIVGVVNHAPKSLRDQLPIGYSSVSTMSGSFVINAELLLGTWLRCVVDKKTKTVTAARPIPPPIHTRCVEYPNSLIRERLLFFGKLKRVDSDYKCELPASPKYECEFLGRVKNEHFGRQNPKYMAEYMFDEDSELVAMKWLNEAEEKRLFMGAFLPTELSFYKTCDGTINGRTFVNFANDMLKELNFNTKIEAFQKPSALSNGNLKASVFNNVPPVLPSPTAVQSKVPEPKILQSKATEPKIVQIKAAEPKILQSKAPEPIIIQRIFNGPEQQNGSVVEPEKPKLSLGQKISVVATPSYPQPAEEASTSSVFTNGNLPVLPKSRLAKQNEKKAKKVTVVEEEKPKKKPTGPPKMLNDPEQQWRFRPRVDEPFAQEEENSSKYSSYFSEIVHQTEFNQVSDDSDDEISKYFKK